MKKLLIALSLLLLSATACINSKSLTTSPTISYLEYSCTQPIKVALQIKQLPADIVEAIKNRFPQGMDNWITDEPSTDSPNIYVGTPGTHPPYFVEGYYDDHNALIYYQYSVVYRAQKSRLIIHRELNFPASVSSSDSPLASQREVEFEFHRLFCTVNPTQPVAKFNLRVSHHRPRDPHYRDHSEPIPGALVNFKNENGDFAFKCQTDAYGWCKIKDAPIGRFSLLPRADAYSAENWDQWVILSEGENPVVEVFMIEGSD